MCRREGCSVCPPVAGLPSGPRGWERQSLCHVCCPVPFVVCLFGARSPPGFRPLRGRHVVREVANLSSRSLKDALLLIINRLICDLLLRYLQVFVSLRLKTCRLYDKPRPSPQPSLFSSFGRPTEPQAIPCFCSPTRLTWRRFEASFSPLYSADNGAVRQSRFRLMCGLLILKHVAQPVRRVGGGAMERERLLPVFLRDA